MVVYNEDFVDGLANHFILVVVYALSGHCLVSVDMVGPDETQLKLTELIGLTDGAAHVAAGYVLPQVLLVQHLYDFAARQFLEPDLVLLLASYNHLFFI